MRAVLQAHNIEGVTSPGADHWFVPDTAYPAVAAALEQRGVMPPG
jgi:hypothetical protein